MCLRIEVPLLHLNMKFQTLILSVSCCFLITSCIFTGKRTPINFNDAIVKSKKSPELNTAYLQFKKEMKSKYLLNGTFQCNGRPDQKALKNEVTLVFFFYMQNSEQHLAKYIVNGNTAFSIGNHFDSSDPEFETAFDFAFLVPNNRKIYEFARHRDLFNMKDIEKKYTTWARFMPDRLRNDTLSTENAISVQDYNHKFLPKNAQIVGKYASIGDEAEETFFIVYYYKEEDRDIPYFEVYNQNNEQTYRKALFDDEFIGKDKHNHSRFYFGEKDFVFENYTVSGGKETVVNQTKIPCMELYENSISK